MNSPPARAPRLERELSRLNHILIPDTKDERDRLFQGRLGRLARPVFRLLSRLSDEGQILLPCLLLIGALGLDVQRSDAYVLWSLLMGAVLSDAWLSRRRRFAGVTLCAIAPAEVRVGEPVRFALTLRNSGTETVGRIRLTGPFLPWDGTYGGTRPGVRQLAPGASTTLFVEATFVALGSHHLDAFRAAPLSPFGLFLGEGTHSESIRFCVVPRIANALLARPIVVTPLSKAEGQAVDRIGDSQEFLGVRPYRPGDRVRSVLARRWARTGAPVVREMRQEASPRATLVLLPPKNRISAEEAEALASLSAGLLAAALHQGAEVTVVVMGARHTTELVRPRKGAIARPLVSLANAASEWTRRVRVDRPLPVAELEPIVRRAATVIVVAYSMDSETLAWLSGLDGRGTDLRVIALHRKTTDPAWLVAAPADAILSGASIPC